MTVRFSVKGDVKAILRDLPRIKRKKVPRITSQVLNRTATKVRTDSTRHVSKVTGIKPQKLIRNRIRVNKSNVRTQRAEVVALTLGISLSKLSKRLQASKAPADAFLVAFPNGKETYVQRSRRAQHSGGRDSKGRVRKGRLPVTVPTVRIQGALESTIPRIIRTRGNPFFKREFRRRLLVELNRR